MSDQTLTGLSRMMDGKERFRGSSVDHQSDPSLFIDFSSHQQLLLASAPSVWDNKTHHLQLLYNTDNRIGLIAPFLHD
jgi:hypothetical protein